MHSFQHKEENLSVAEAQEVLRRRLEGSAPNANVSLDELSRALGISSQEVTSMVESIRVEASLNEARRKRRKIRDVSMASVAAVFALVGVFVAGMVFSPKVTFGDSATKVVSGQAVEEVAQPEPGLTFVSNNRLVAQTKARLHLEEAPSSVLLIDQSLLDLERAFPNHFEQQQSTYGTEMELGFLAKNSARGQLAFVRLDLTAIGKDGRTTTSELIWPVYSGSSSETLKAVQQARRQRLKEALQEVARQAELTNGAPKSHPNIASIRG